jgi:hypothetical protein
VFSKSKVRRVGIFLAEKTDSIGARLSDREKLSARTAGGFVKGNLS